MNFKNLKAIKKSWRIISLTAVLMLGLVLAGARQGSFVQANDDDGRRTARYALGSTGLVAGQKLRTTLTNFGNRRINVQTKVIDADGVVVKQEPLTLEPGQMHTFETSRTEVPRDGQAVLLRIEVIAQRRDARNVLVSSAVIVWATGSTSFPLKDVDDDPRLSNFEIQQGSSQ